MLTLFWTGALLSAYLGYKQHEWWMPAAVAGAALAGQFTLFRWWQRPSPKLLGFAYNFVMFFAQVLEGRWSVGKVCLEKGDDERGLHRA